MANFTTENNTYCFRIGPAFLDTYNEVLDTGRTIFSVTEIVKVMEKKLVIANIFCQSLGHSLNRDFTVVFSTSFGLNWGHFMRFSVPMTLENTKTGTNKD